MLHRSGRDHHFKFVILTLATGILAAGMFAQTMDPTTLPATAAVATTEPATTGPVISASATTVKLTTQPAATLPATTTATTAPAVDPEAAEQSAFALETRAYTSDARSDYQAAAEALEKCSSADSDNLRLERSLGFLWLDKLADPARAYPHLAKVHAMAPDENDWTYLLANASGRLGKIDQQFDLLRAILKRDPDNKEAKDALALAFGLTVPTTAPATTVASEAAKISNAHASLLQAAFDLETQAYTSDSRADFQAAAEALELCSRFETGNVRLERSVGFLWLDKLKDPGKGYPHLEKAWKLDSADAGWGSLLARAAGETGRTDRQLQVLGEVADRNPQNANARLELAQALDKSGRHDAADHEFQAALALGTEDESILTAYGQYLHARGRDTKAKQLADKALAINPKSSPALSLEGDIHRSEWNLADAQVAYEQSLAEDPDSESARKGLGEIHQSKVPSIESSYYYFKGNDGFLQQGLFDTLSLSLSDHIYANANYNMGYFRDNKTSFHSVIRYQEGVGIEDRINGDVSLRAGASAFQQRKKEASGFNIGATWKPINELWIDASYHSEDPVNDSMYTVGNALSQDILAFTGGYQPTDDLAVKFSASRSVYSDNTTREWVHLEPDYTIWETAKMLIGAEYEAYRYSKQLPGDGGVNWYQTIGPVIEVEPTLTGWLSLHARAEFPYVVPASQWGSNLNLDLKFHPGDHLELKAGIFYVHVPQSISSYSGSGFDASVSCRF